jgi:hypothetical protein
MYQRVHAPKHSLAHYLPVSHPYNPAKPAVMAFSVASRATSVQVYAKKGGKAAPKVCLWCRASDLAGCALLGLAPVWFGALGAEPASGLQTARQALLAASTG